MVTFTWAHFHFFGYTTENVRFYTLKHGILPIKRSHTTLLGFANKIVSAYGIKFPSHVA